jgi:hypothetical protein
MPAVDISAVAAINLPLTDFFPYYAQINVVRLSRRRGKLLPVWAFGIGLVQVDEAPQGAIKDLGIPASTGSKA